MLSWIERRTGRGSTAARLNDYAGADLEALERWVEIGRERAGWRGPVHG
jgi:hypothetical protein